MKSIRFFSVLLIFISLITNEAYSKSVDENTARQIGYSFINRKIKNNAVTGTESLSLVYTSKSAAGVANFYVYNVPNGFVMVSAEDAVKPIIAFSNEAEFHQEKLAAAVGYMLNGYKMQIESVKQQNLEATTEVAETWGKLSGTVAPGRTERTTSVVVAPLLGTLIWDQSPYYNDSCPNDPTGGGRSVTGCVATATSQVMKFWNWPAQGTGSHSYTSTTRGFTLSANFGATTYNWASMPNAIAGHNTAIAQLIYHVGVAVDMDYTASESGAYTISSATGTPPYCAQYALTQFFKYDPAIQGLSRSSYTDAVWMTKLTTEISAGRPVIYAGQGSAGGHCWVLDGYDDTLGTNYFHANWGWSGSGPNGYYSIDDMNPPALGTGGGGGGFNSDQQAIIGIKPNMFPITGTLTVCPGATTTLADATTGGTWTSGSTSVATISSSGVVTGVSAGTSVITYSVGSATTTATITVNPAPNAGTVSPSSAIICLTQTQTLTDAATGGTWSSTNPSAATVSGGVVTAVAGGTTTISYTVTNSCGTAASSSTITVHGAPPITSAPSVATPGATPCVGTSATYTASCTGATSFVWTVSGTGWFGTSTTGTIITNVGSGNGTIVVTGSNACGNGPAYTVNVSPDSIPSVPVLSMVGTLPCTGATSATYNATSTGATAYVWSVSGSGWSGSSTTSTIVLALGTGTATLICNATNGCGSSRSDTASVSSSPLPTSPVIALSGSVPCLGATSATYTATSGGATSYIWTVTGTGWSGSSTTGTLNVTIGSGSGTITCSGVNTCGTGTLSTQSLTPATPTGAATAISATTGICSGINATFITSAITGATSYIWTVTGTGWSGSSTTTMLNVIAGTGSATITVEGTGPCGTGTPFTLASITPAITPVAGFAVGTHVTSTGTNDLVTYSGSATTSGGLYSWNFAGGTAMPGVGVGPHLVSWSTPGLKTITLSVTDGGCTSEVYSDTVLVGTPTDLSTFADNGNVLVLPNPNQGTFEVLFGETVSGNINLKLTDMAGRMVYAQNFDGTQNHKIGVSVDNLPSGVYNATLITDGKVQNLKIVIRK